MLPTSIARRCSAPWGERSARSTAAADDTAYTTPITASCDTCRVRLRVRASTSAPRIVAASPNQYDPGSSGSNPTRNAAVAPRAAIWASAMSTNTTSRAIT